MFPTIYQNKSRNKTGFTFIEMMFVLALLSLIGLAIVTTLSNGISIWQDLNLAAGSEDVNIFFERFSRELRNTFEFSKIGFQGDTRQVSFATFVVTPGSNQPQETGIGQVIYSYDRLDRELTREKRNFSQISQEKNGSRQQFLKNLGNLKFSYYFYDEKKKEYMWLEEWQAEEPPLAVKIELESYNGQRIKRITRTINIPISKLRQKS